MSQGDHRGLRGVKLCFLFSSQCHSVKGLPQALTDLQSARNVARLQVEIDHRRAKKQETKSVTAKPLARKAARLKVQSLC